MMTIFSLMLFNIDKMVELKFIQPCHIGYTSKLYCDPRIFVLELSHMIDGTKYCKHHTAPSSLLSSERRQEQNILTRYILGFPVLTTLEGKGVILLLFRQF